MAILPQIFFCKKACFFLVMKKVVNTKICKNACIFRDFLCFCVKKKIKSEKTCLGAAVQRGGIKIGGSGGGWKSRLKGVDGCSNGVTVGEIALVVFYYSIIYLYGYRCMITEKIL